MGVGLIYGRSRVDPRKNSMAVAINWGPCRGCPYKNCLTIWGFLIFGNFQEGLSFCLSLEPSLAQLRETFCHVCARGYSHFEIDRIWVNRTKFWGSSKDHTLSTPRWLYVVGGFSMLAGVAEFRHEAAGRLELGDLHLVMRISSCKSRIL